MYHLCYRDSVIVLCIIKPCSFNLAICKLLSFYCNKLILMHIIASFAIIINSPGCIANCTSVSKNYQFSDEKRSFYSMEYCIYKNTFKIVVSKG